MTDEDAESLDFVLALVDKIAELKERITSLESENADMKTALERASPPTIRCANGEEIHIGFIPRRITPTDPQP